MALIDWRPEYETGIREVDAEHRELIELINELHDRLGSGATPEAVSCFLGEVFARIAAHFALEEADMRKYAYDEYASHKAEHERLLDELRDIMDSHEASHQGYGPALADTLRNWFVNHFKSKDARLHRLLGAPRR
jgi:hemerythrin-like metal-binding protein